LHPLSLHTTSLLSSPFPSLFFFYCYAHHRHLHSFPTRRSSDLASVVFRYSAAAVSFPVGITPVLVVSIRTRPRASATSSSWCCRSEEHTSELQSRENLVCRLLLEKKKKR